MSLKIFIVLLSSNSHGLFAYRTVCRAGNTGSGEITEVKHHYSGPNVGWLTIVNFNLFGRVVAGIEVSYTRLANQPWASMD
jgi:hypothetical protein